jgi:hypothetical protein
MAEGKLREVEQDAMRNAAKHFRDQEETLQYEALKSKGVEVKTPEQVLSEVQKTTSPDVSKQPVELVSEDKVKEANKSADEAKPLSEVPNPSSSDKVEINVDPEDGLRVGKKGKK